ncbi:MAG: DUF448 domain-containing protein [Sandaracinus sp.]|nr:DUF448 domain-containing protein [Sandaracinus sp.]
MEATTRAPIRTCAGCREALPQEELVRLAVVPEAPWLVPDAKGKLGGRGVWVMPSVECIERAAKKGGFARALKRKVDVDPIVLVDLITKQLEDRFRGLVLGALRAGHLKAGVDVARDSVERGRAHLLWVAEDAGRREDVEARAARLGAACLVWGTRETLGDYLGRGEVAVVAIEDEGLANAIVRVTNRLAGLRAGCPSPHKHATPEDRKPA